VGAEEAIDDPDVKSSLFDEPALFSEAAGCSSTLLRRIYRAGSRCCFCHSCAVIAALMIGLLWDLPQSIESKAA
jgi:hypothetical protein